MAAKSINVPDPYDMEAKRKLHPQADEKNFIDDRGVLVCGARKKHGPGFCRSRAGFGTHHKGYGRCKFCGGSSTGPKTAEGKANSAGNNRTHGLYSAALGEEERALYEEMIEAKENGLMHEILVLKVKIITYLSKWRKKWEEIASREGAEAADKATKVWFNVTENGARNYYHAGTIEDKAFDRALNTLGRLVEKHARLTQDNGDDLLAQINAELRAASHGQVSISWGGKAQERVEKPIN